MSQQVRDALKKVAAGEKPWITFEGKRIQLGPPVDEGLCLVAIRKPFMRGRKVVLDTVVNKDGKTHGQKFSEFRPVVLASVLQCSERDSNPH